MSRQQQSKHVIAARAKRQAMLGLIQKNGVATYAELHAITGLTDQGILGHMKILRDDKLVEIVKHPHKTASGGHQASVFVRPGFVHDFGPEPVRADAEMRASDFHGVRIVRADGSEIVGAKPDDEPGKKVTRTTSEATNAKAFGALPGTVQQIMAATKLSKASAGSACNFLVADERAHIGRYDFIASNGHWAPVYFAGPGVSVPHPAGGVVKPRVIAPIVRSGARRDPLVAALFGPAGAEVAA